jgi:hypothetical protein
MIDNVFIFKSEHPDFPHDFYVTLNCDKSKEYLKNFPCAGRIIKENDPEIKVICDSTNVTISSKKSGYDLFKFNINILISSFLTEIKNNQIIGEIEFVHVFIFRPIFNELLFFDDPMKTPYQKFYIDEIG